jgi:hypothetical protein
MVNVLRLVDDAVGRDQIVPKDGPDSGLRLLGVPNVVFYGAEIKVQSAGRDVNFTQDESVAKITMATNKNKLASSWANGSFYLFAFLMVMTALGVLAKSVSPYALPLIVVAGAIFVPVIGALQLKNDEKLPDKSFLELMKMALGQLPLIGRLAQNKEKEA